MFQSNKKSEVRYVRQRCHGLSFSQEVVENVEIFAVEHFLEVVRPCLTHSSCKTNANPSPRGDGDGGEWLHLCFGENEVMSFLHLKTTVIHQMCERMAHISFRKRLRPIQWRTRKFAYTAALGIVRSWLQVLNLYHTCNSDHNKS